jgi:hypothetical protein
MKNASGFMIFIPCEKKVVIIQSGKFVKPPARSLDSP